MKAIDTTAVSLLLIGVFLSLMTDAPAQTPKSEAPRIGTHDLSKEDDAAIRKVITGIEEAWNAHDMKAYARLFREDADWINIVGMHWRGRDAVMAAHVAFHESMFKNNRMTIDAIETRSLGNDFAIAVATMTHDAFLAPDGRTFPKAQNRCTHVLAKGPDGWKIVHGHNVQVDAEAAKHDPVNKKDGPAEDDLKALQGTWVTLKLVTNGKVEVDLKEPPKEGPASTLTYDGHKWVVKAGDKELASGTSKLDPSKTPKHIDLTHESGPLKGQTVLGIYKLVGDEYSACIAAPGKARPTEFASQAGNGQRFVVSKREKR
jgi:uncharacterized protein (TIGR02246 family)